jgi:hypothetical protein
MESFELVGTLVVVDLVDVWRSDSRHLGNGVQ